MPSRSKPLSNYPVMHSSDPEFVRDRMFRISGANRFDVGKANNAFSVNANHLQIGGLGLLYWEFEGDLSVGFGGESFITQAFAIEGAVRYVSRKQSGEVAAGGWSPIIPAHAPLNVDYKSGYRQLVLRIEFDTLRRYLGALVGKDVQKLEFDATPARHPAMEALRRRLFHVAIDYNERGVFFSDLAAAEVERMVIMKFLMCHRHNHTHLLLREPLPASSTAVRAVEEFIEANWDKPIDIDAMVAIAKVSARSLFRQFRRDRGHSPADFAKRVRLNHARGMLEQPRNDTSVIQIALRCGFQNPGHFARDYRALFGELPSATLQRSRRWQS